MKSNRHTPRAGGSRRSESLAAHALLALVYAALACGAASAQGPVTHQREEVAPPPMRYVPQETRAKLAGARDLGARTRLSLGLAEERLARAAEYVAADRFEAATGELGIYEAIVLDAVRQIQGSGPVNNKKRDLFKRVEMTLRSHVPRIETIRRGLPSQHAANVKATLDFVRDARDQALNSFFDHTVLPAPRRAPEQDRAKGATLAPPEKERKPQRR